MAGSTVVVSVLADTAKFRSGMDSAGKQAGGLGKAFKGIGLGVAAIGVGAAVGIGKLVKDSIDAARESEKVSAQTAAVVKSTGMAAGRSADQIGDLALKLSNLTGVDDEVVQGAENIIATFTNIKGKQFDDTTKAALDLSTALGTSVTSAATQLGKALNDPEKGLSKLSKSGVTFTASQKAAVAAMVKTGDIAGAQGIILGEVNKEFGGSAAAYGATLDGTVAKVGNAFGNLQETIGGAFLPVITKALGKVATFIQNLGVSKGFTELTNNVAAFLDRLVSGQSGVTKFFGALIGVASSVSPLAAVFRYLMDNVKTVGPVFLTLGKALGGALLAILPTIVNLAKSFGSVLTTVVAAAMPIVITLISQFSGILRALLPSIVQVATTLGAALGTVLTALVPIIGQLITQLGPVLTQIINALAPLFVLVAQTLAQLLPVILPLITTAILPLVSAVLELIGPLLQLAAQILTPLIGLLVVILKPILALAVGIISVLVPVIGFLVKALTAVAKFIVGGLISAVSGLISLFTGSFAAGINLAGKVWGVVWNGIKAVFSVQVAIVRAGVSALVGFFSGVWGSIVSGVSGFGSRVGEGIGKVVGFFRELPGKITSAVGNLGSLLLSQGRNIIDGLVNGVRNNIGAVLGIGADIGKNLLNSVKNVLGIHSPSREMAALGAFSVAGLAKGLSNVKPILSASKALSAAVSDGYDPDLSTAALTTSGTTRSGNSYVIHLSTLNPTPEVGRMVVEAIDDYERINGKRSA